MQLHQKVRFPKVNMKLSTLSLLAFICCLPTAASLWVQTEQWVASVDSFSTQYGESRWSANQVVGAPDVYPSYGDIDKAWTPKAQNTYNYLVLNFGEKVKINGIDIYETFNGGAVVKVTIKNADTNEWVTVWQTDKPQVITQSRIFSVPVNQLEFASNQIRIDVDGGSNNVWTEIDAVKLKGLKNVDSCYNTPCANGAKCTVTGESTFTCQCPMGFIGSDCAKVDPHWKQTEQWVSSVDSFSTQYSDSNWSANQVIGAPDVYPAYGDINKAYTTKAQNTYDYLVLNFQEKVYPNGVDVYETFNAGGVVKLLLLNADTGKWVQVWSVDKPQVITQSRIFSIPFVQQDFPCQQIRIELNGASNNAWVEIDAVKLKGLKKIDPCENNPCANGGVCTSNAQNYVCKCAAGWGGNDCSEAVSECLKENPCKNGGTCGIIGEGYTCRCATGFAGRHCDMDVAACKAVSDSKRINCGWGGVTLAQCNAKSCCFDDTASSRNQPACFYSKNICSSSDVSERVDCYKQGPSAELYCNGRGCCWDATVPATGLRCFRVAAKGSCLGVPASQRVPHPIKSGMPNDCEADGGCWDSSIRDKPNLWCFDVKQA